MIENNTTKFIVDFLKNHYIATTMFRYVVHGLSMPTKGSQPLFRFDRILFLGSFEELRYSHKAIISKLKAVPADLPCVNMCMVCREWR